MIIIGDHKVYETLPAGMVDLDKCSVYAWPVIEGEIPELVDNVVDSGCVVLCDTDKGTEKKIYWGKTKANPDGICDIVIDAPTITKDILLAMYVMNVLPE